MASLTGNSIASTYTGLLKTADNGAISTTPSNITDGSGNATALSISTTNIVVSGSLVLSGSLLVDGTAALAVTASNAISSSYAVTASYVQNAVSASHAVVADTALTASYIPGYTTPTIATNGTTIYTVYPNTTNFSTVDGVFIGDNAGTDGVAADYSVFIGSFAGDGAASASNAVFLGSTAGQDAENAAGGVFIGNSAGQSATNAASSIFIGSTAGQNATDAVDAVFIGNSAGQGAATATVATFIGTSAGLDAVAADHSNFIGEEAGSGATNASFANFLGGQAGKDATDALNSIFIGLSAGQNAANSSNSNYLGTNAGKDALDADNSNFIGSNAGQEAALATNSNFIGTSAGQAATNASYSTLIGYQAGALGGGTTGIGTNNIIIGTNITLPDDTVDTTNLGGVVFISGTHNDVGAINPLSGSVEGARVGIGTSTPSATLDVSGSLNVSGSLTQNGYEVKPYRAYAAILSQTGTTDTQFLYGAPIVVGVSYTIANNDAELDDFTNVGATSNATGTSFVATGTIPAVWTNGSFLVWDPAAPVVVSILENTLGCDIIWSYLSVGSYIGQIQNSQITTFGIDKYFAPMPQGGYDTAAQVGGGGDPYSWYRTNDSQISVATTSDGNLQNCPIGIKVYN